jgi:hypothetical protein
VKRQIDEDPSFAAPLLVWLALQLLAIAMAAARVKLWARFGSAGETYALDELTVAQFLGSSLLFPALCRSFKSTLAMVVSSLPMIALAGYLSFGSFDQCASTAINLAIWLTGLAVWWKVVNRLDGGALLVVSIASAANIGGLMVAYLTAETTNRELSGFAVVPILSAIRVSHFPTLLCFIPASAVSLSGLCALVISSNLAGKRAVSQDPGDPANGLGISSESGTPRA